MLAVTRLRLPHDALVAAARSLLTVLSGQHGFERGVLGQALDDPALWVLSTEWTAVGAYRRGLSAYDVKLAFAPLMGHVLDEPGAFEVTAETHARSQPAAE